MSIILFNNNEVKEKELKNNLYNFFSKAIKIDSYSNALQKDLGKFYEGNRNKASWNARSKGNHV